MAYDALRIRYSATNPILRSRYVRYAHSQPSAQPASPTVILTMYRDGFNMRMKRRGYHSIVIITRKNIVVACYHRVFSGELFFLLRALVARSFTYKHDHASTYIYSRCWGDDNPSAIWPTPIGKRMPSDVRFDRVWLGPTVICGRLLNDTDRLLCWYVCVQYPYMTAVMRFTITIIIPISIRYNHQ